MPIRKKLNALHVDEAYLSSCLLAFFKVALPSIQDCYSWDMPAPFEPSLTPMGHNDFERNLSLRRLMSEENQNADDNRKVQLAIWYVEKWGRVTARSNNPNKIAAFRKGVSAFAVLDPKVVAARGKNRIASWSKVLSYRDYDNCAVYDARVAGSLNAIQIVYGDGLKHRFPALGTDGAAAEAFQAVLAETGNSTRPIPSSGVYDLYCALLRQQWHRIPMDMKAHAIDWQGLEMALFHHSHALFEQAVEKLERTELYRQKITTIKAKKAQQRNDYARRKKAASLG